MNFETSLHLRASIFGVLLVGLFGCGSSEGTPTAREDQALGLKAEFIWSCPQPNDPEFPGNAGDWCLVQYGGDTSMCSGLCCPAGSVLTYDGDGGGFKGGPAYCTPAKTTSGGAN